MRLRDDSMINGLELCISRINDCHALDVLYVYLLGLVYSLCKLYHRISVRLDSTHRVVSSSIRTLRNA